MFYQVQEVFFRRLQSYLIGVIRSQDLDGHVPIGNPGLDGCLVFHPTDSLEDERQCLDRKQNSGDLRTIKLNKLIASLIPVKQRIDPFFGESFQKRPSLRGTERAQFVQSSDERTRVLFGIPLAFGKEGKIEDVPLRQVSQKVFLGKSLSRDGDAAVFETHSFREVAVFDPEDPCSFGLPEVKEESGDPCPI